MTVTRQQPVRLSASSWRVAFSSDIPGAIFSVYFKGALIQQSQQGWALIQSNAEPCVEAYDDSTTPDQQLYPGRLTLQWYHVAGAIYYQVQENVSGTWTTRQQIGDAGAQYYQYLTPWLADAATAQWRVLALDALRNPGVAASVAVPIVRNPDTPGSVVGYSGGNLTVAAG